MGKASRWILNLLLGKKEEKEKRKNVCLYEDYMKTPNGSIPSTPTYKRRWSFGKSTGKEKTHKTCKSLDSITPLITQHAALLEWEKQQNCKNKVAADRILKSVEYAAATRIQASYRSYLARKALCALRALVKLQALARGHLVRKKTTATLKQMHALMAIQVRARFQRVQMAEEESAQLAIRSLSYRHGNIRLDSGLREAEAHKKSKAMDLNNYETKRILKDDHDYLNHSQTERSKYYSGEVYISKRKNRYEEFSFPTAVNSPQICSPTLETIPGRASFTYQKPDYMQPISHPSYMANTESSRAKVRSQSEPKQRPKGSTRPKSKVTASIDDRNVQLQQGSSFNSTPFAYENPDPWFTRVFQPSNPKDGECDAKSSASSNYSKLLATYEPHLHMF